MRWIALRQYKAQKKAFAPVELTKVRDDLVKSKWENRRMGEWENINVRM